jgi:hypothetical protein
MTITPDPSSPSESTRPDMQRFTWREWQVITDDDGISFSINATERDAQERAARWVRHGDHLALAEYETWTSPTVLVSRSVVEAACGRDVGKRPSWMSSDQYDPCPCVLKAGHQPPCECRHGEST